MHVVEGLSGLKSWRGEVIGGCRGGFRYTGLRGAHSSQTSCRVPRVCRRLEGGDWALLESTDWPGSCIVECRSSWLRQRRPVDDCGISGLAGTVIFREVIGNHPGGARTGAVGILRSISGGVWEIRMVAGESTTGLTGAAHGAADKRACRWALDEPMVVAALCPCPELARLRGGDLVLRDNGERPSAAERIRVCTSGWVLRSGVVRGNAASDRLGVPR